MQFRKLFCIAALATLLCCTTAEAQPSLRDAIDREIVAAWQRENVNPAPPADDATFLRRVYIDLAGTIPTYDETVAFLADEDADKRSKLIDRLLDDPRYAQHQADAWDMVLFGRNPPGYQTDQRDGFQKWLRDQIAANTPYNEWVRAMLRAEGNSVDDGPPMYLVQYRNAPEDAAVAVTQRFLGIQLQCARCHDHPFESWTQLDFYGMAAFFARLEVVSVGKQDRDTKWMIGEKNLGDVLFTGPATEQTPGKKGEPVGAKFLGGDQVEEPTLPDDFSEPRNFPANKEPPKPMFSRKDVLADWVAAPDNPYLARALANRVWAQFMGRGLIHPVDNMSPANKPSHPELLDTLADAIRARNFDLKWLIRELVSSKTYQLAATGDVADAMPQWFQRARTRPLSAEELVASWRVATNYDQASGKDPSDDRFFGVTSGYALRFFGEPATGTGDFQGGLHEHLYLNNGQVAQLISTAKDSLHHSLATSNEPWEERVDRLYLSILNRPPADEERTRFVEYLSVGENANERLREAIWTLMTCSEFRFNH